MLKIRGTRLVLASSVWLTLYVVCVFFVASFIFFEVLDVDGSDFPVHPAKMAARLAEPQHDDLKRSWLHQPVKIWTGATVSLEVREPERAERDVRVPPSPVDPVRERWAALPRAALADVPPSA